MMEAGKVGNGNRLRFTLLLAYLLTALIITYFYSFPTLINPLFSDILIVLGVFLLLPCLIYASIKAKSSREVILVLLGIMLLSILARSIPHLRLAYPPFADPYRYAIATLNIIDYGTLQPILSEWYSGVSAHLHWPMMHLFTALAVKITGIDSMWFFRFQEPLLGGIFALIVFALAKEATKNNTIALLSALFASASDVVIFFQSEYHAQGFALIFFALFLYIYLKSRTTRRLSYYVLSLVCLVVFLLSHHFSSLFVALLAISFVGLNHLISILPQRMGRITQVAREVRADYNLWTIIAVAGLAYHFMTYFSPVQAFLTMLVEKQPASTLLAGGAGVPMLTTLLNSAKWGILLLAAFSIVKIIRTPRPHEFRLLVLLVCILLAGVVGNYITWAPTDRIIAFYILPVSVFAAMTVHKLFTLNKVSLRRTQAIKAATVFIVGLLLTAGFLNGIPIPAFYFQTSQVNSYYWYCNHLPPMEQHKAAGEWLGEYTSKESRYGVEWDTRITPFFFGQRPAGSVHYLSISPTFDYALVNSAMPDEHTRYSKLQIDQGLSRIYNNGELVIYSRLR